MARLRFVRYSAADEFWTVYSGRVPVGSLGSARGGFYWRIDGVASVRGLRLWAGLPSAGGLRPGPKSIAHAKRNLSRAWARWCKRADVR